MPSSLRPFFSYYGAKWQASLLYPPPKHRRLVEPFAGAAGYSVRYHYHAVELYDVDPTVIGVWAYLIRAKEREILSLPVGFDRIDEIPLRLCEEARWLIGFCMNQGSTSPGTRASSWAKTNPDMFWSAKRRARISAQLRFVRHWKVTLASYETIPDGEATWFVDPPYNNKAGRHYTHSEIDYPALGRWCRKRPGQVIVCEQDGADWLPFKSIGLTHSAAKTYSAEAVWIR